MTPEERPHAVSGATESVKEIVQWSRFSSFAALVCFVLTAIGFSFALFEYLKFRAAVASASDELEKVAEKLGAPGTPRFPPRAVTK
jgi:hypothetical protein